jgi:small subunit ribosomal protein S1
MPDDSFASLFEAEAKQGPSGHRKVRVGETIEAAVVQVGRETIFLEFDGKRQAMLDVIEVQNPDGTVDVKVGEMLRAKVIEVDAESGQVRLGRTFGKSGDLAHIQQAFEAGVAIEGKVAGTNKGGLEVDLGKGSRGFCPNSQVGLRAGPPPGDLVGQSLSFLVTEIKDGGRSIVLSRRRLLEAEAREGRDAVLGKLEKGKLVTGTVTAVRDFGAFVDLGGIEGLLPASEISHERGIPVSDRIKAGERVEAQVLDIRDDDKGQKRITLSLKALLPAPERDAAKSGTKPSAKLAIGSVVTGKVSRVENYGVFVQVAGTEGRGGRGLVPASELNVPHGTDLRKRFPEGTELTAKVLETGDGRLKLSVRGALDAAERADFEAHLAGSGAPSAEGAAGAKKGASFGTFGDLLKKATEKKK